MENKTSQFLKYTITLDNVIQYLKRQKEASAYILRIVESKNQHVSDSLKFIENQETHQEGTGFTFPNFNRFSCYLYLEEAFESLVSIYISSYYNSTWFEQLKTQVQTIIVYMEQNHNELRE